MIGEQLGEDATRTAGQVTIGIETDRGPWVAALVAAGYTVIAVNPLQAARYRERLGVSGAKSDAADAHILADMVRTDSHQLRPVAGDSCAGRGGQGRHAHAQDADLGTDPVHAAAAARAAGLLPGRGGGVRGPGRRRHPGAAGQGARPGVGGPADDCADQRCPQAGPAPRHRGEGRADPGRAARRPPGPARGRDRRLRGLGAGPGRGAGHPQRAGQDPGRAGGSPFWPAPGR